MNCSFNSGKKIPVVFCRLDYNNTSALCKDYICQDFELCVISGHHVSIRVNDTVFSPRWGDVIIIRKGDCFQPLYTASDSTRYYKITFPEDFLKTQPDNSPFCKLFISDKFKEYSYIDTSVETSQKLFDYIHKIEAELDLNGLYAFSHITGLVDCICNEPLLNFKLSSDYAMDKKPPALHSALQYIYSNYLNINTTTEVAEKCHISVSYLCRIFRKHMKCSTVDYINSCKVSHAKHLLIGGHSATETCYLSGFNNYNYFALVFKKNVGLSPQQYISKHK